MPEEVRLKCAHCPRGCRLKPGQRGFCFARQNLGGKIVDSLYGHAAGIAIDPVEKKPLYHFLPGSEVLSFGTLGCNMGCLFCQNFHLSKNRDLSQAGYRLAPRQAAELALRKDCQGIAFTYNEPLIWSDYAINCAKEAHKLGLKSVAVSAGYVNPEGRREFFAHMDGANIDLKAFSPAFYKKYCQADINVVLETLKYIKKETACWLEITTLLIPGLNDSQQEISALAEWIASELGEQVPLHLSAFHPAYKLTDLPHTPPDTVISAARTARKSGLKYVYTGNIYDPDNRSTHCADCGAVLIERGRWKGVLKGLDAEKRICKKCGSPLPGVF
ncbi:AmmeMemoRadiSam system radical SAM enzyme [bacterium]|nr:AmmeMemoRadiSam system radical SAM enzyme [bacterium]